MKTLKLGTLKPEYHKAFKTYGELAEAHHNMVKQRRTVNRLKTKLGDTKLTYHDYLHCVEGKGRGRYDSGTGINTLAGVTPGTLLFAGSQVVEHSYQSWNQDNKDVWIDVADACHIFRRGIDGECEALEWEMAWRTISKAKDHLLLQRTQGYISTIMVGKRKRSTKEHKVGSHNVEIFCDKENANIADAWVVIDRQTKQVYLAKDAPLDLDKIMVTYTAANLTGVSIGELRRRM